MRVPALFVSFVLLVAACGSPDSPAATSAECAPGTDEALRQWEAVGFSGAVAFSSAGELDCAAGYGLADEEAGVANTAETVFSVGSITKTFTAAAVLALVDDGQLTLDDTAGEWLTALAGPVADLTISQLLTHTSGLTGRHGRDHEPLGRDAAIDAIGALELAFEPGTDSLYSNSGYTLLALIVEEASGMSYRDYAAERILTLPDGTVVGGFWDGEPAAPEPRAVGYLDNGEAGEAGDFAGPHWALDGNGGLAMTPGQLAAWSDALFAGEIISPAAVETMTTPLFDYGDGTGESPGWVVIDESVFGVAGVATAGGGGSIGHNMTVLWFPDEARGFVLASNTPDVSAEGLLQSVLPELIAGEALPAPAPPGEADPAVAGTYALDPANSFAVEVADGRLQVAAIGPEAIAALFAVPAFVSPDDVAQHERLVEGFVAGETEEGQNEIAMLEAEFGPMRSVRIDGTIFADGELRTYLTASFDDGEVVAWLALDDRGGLAGAEVSPPPPRLAFGASGENVYVPLDIDGTDPDVVLSFDGAGTMTVDGPGGAVEAAR